MCCPHGYNYVYNDDYDVNDDASPMRCTEADDVELHRIEIRGEGKRYEWLLIYKGKDGYVWLAFSCRKLEEWRQDNNILLVAPKIQVLDKDVMGYQCSNAEEELFDLAVPVDGVRKTYFLEYSGIAIVSTFTLTRTFCN